MKATKKHAAEDRGEVLPEELTLEEERHSDYEYPKVSIVIPTYNCAATISLTIESVLSQEYPDFEIIVVDATSTDCTTEILKGYRDDRIQLYTVSGYNRYAMLNKGISQAEGEYINFLFPGDFYIYKVTLKLMMGLALDNDKPYLVYCGTLLRYGSEEVKVLFRPLNLALLKQGLQPTSLQSCWIRADVFQVIGKFDTVYQLRGGYDLMCRFCMHGNCKSASLSRVLTDYDIRFITQKMLYLHFTETWKTIRHHFGLLVAIRWLFVQRDLYRFLAMSAKRIKFAFLGR